MQLVVARQPFALHHLGLVHCSDVCELCAVLSENFHYVILCHASATYASVIENHIILQPNLADDLSV